MNREDRMAHLLLPAVRSTRPRRVMQQVVDVENAIQPGGYIKDRALLPITNTFADGEVSSITDSNASAVTFRTYLGGTLVVPDGTWRLKFKSGLCGRLSTTSNLNTQLLVSLTASGNFQIPLASGDLGTVWQRLTLDQVPGGSEIEWAVQYRPSAGTATIESGFVDWHGERM